MKPEQHPIPQTTIKDTPKPKRSKKWLWWMLAILVIAGAAFAGYYFEHQKATKDQQQLEQQLSDAQKQQINLNNSKANLQKQLDELKSTQTSATTAPSVSAALQQNLKAALDSGNTAAIESYMADQVTYIVAASSGQGTVSKADATTQITNFITDAQTPWNFSISASTLSTYKNGSYKTYLTNETYFATSANNKFIAFGVDSAGKINQVFMAASTDLLTQ